MIVKSLQEFYDCFEIGRPIIAFDHGQKKIGVALSTPDHKFSMPHKLITENVLDKQLKECTKTIVETNSCAIVVGLPLNMNCTESEQTKIVQKFTDALAKLTSLPIYLQDERLTSKTADNLLKTFGLKRKKRNEFDDPVAANLILETILLSVKNI